MKSVKYVIFIAIFLIVLGGTAFVLEQLSYTRSEKALEIGPIEVTVQKEAHCYRLPRIFGVLTIVSGIALIALVARRRP
jgi:hypothetical protein